MANNSPGVYDRIVDRAFVVNAGGIVAGGIVISAKRGPVGIKIVTSSTEFLETYGAPTRDNPSLHVALRFLSRAGLLTVRRVINDAVTAEGILMWEGEDEDQNPITEEHMTIKATNEGAWGNKIKVQIVELEDAPDGVFGVNVWEGDDVVETFEVSRDTDAKNGFGNTIFIEDVINARSRYIRVEDNPMVTDAYAMGIVEMEGGADDSVAPTAGMISDAWDDFLNAKEVPAQILINGGWAVPAVQSKMLAVAQSRKDAIAILDVPEDTKDDVAAMIAYRKSELAANTYFGAIYGGWVKIQDTYNDRIIDIPPSGDVAGVLVSTFAISERWDAPAGLQRGIIPNTVGVSKIMSQGERDLLDAAGVNAVTAIGGAAAVVWGQKTLQVQASALDRLNVVNNILWINQSMATALEPFVFEPNTDQTRDAINFLLSSFLENIQLRGGLYDFFVDTSSAINTPFVIDNNEMLVDVYVQPTRTAERIKISTIITPTGVQLG